MKKLLPLSLIFALLGGCAAAPSQVILNPKYQSGQLVQGQGSLNLQIRDTRPSNATMVVVKGDNKRSLSAPGLDGTLTQTLTSAFSANGIEVSYKSARTMTVEIHHLQAIVNEQTFDHQSEAVIELGVQVNANGRTFNKLYNGKSALAGPLGHDQAKIEAQLNKLIEQLVSRIVSDPELNTFLQES